MLLPLKATIQASKAELNHTHDVANLETEAAGATADKVLMSNGTFVSYGMIGNANISSDIADIISGSKIEADFTGQTITADNFMTTGDLLVEGAVDLPNNSLTISNVTGLQAELDSKATVIDLTNIGTRVTNVEAEQLTQKHSNCR